MLSSFSPSVSGLPSSRIPSSSTRLSFAISVCVARLNLRIPVSSFADLTRRTPRPLSLAFLPLSSLPVSSLPVSSSHPRWFGIAWRRATSPVSGPLRPVLVASYVAPLSRSLDYPLSIIRRLPVGLTSSPALAARLDSRKSLLSADPDFSQFNAKYSPTHAHNRDFSRDYSQAYPQPPYQQPTYAENANLNRSFDQGYAYRQSLASSTPARSVYHDRMGFLKTKWPAAFMTVTSLQAIVCLGFESYIFGKFQTSLAPDRVTNPDVQSQYLTIPTFLTLFIFGFLYELVVVWDALRMKNTIQVIGVCIANLALLVYTAIQVDQIQSAIGALARNDALRTNMTNEELWADVKPFLVAIPAVIALATVVMTFIAWKLYREFAWDILKNIGADYRMKKRFLHYQIYIALLKFDFFFFLGFIIQFVVIVTSKTDPEFVLTIATIPITIIILLAAAYFTRRENKLGMMVVIILYLGGLTYFIFKIVRIYQEGYVKSYLPVRKSLTAFAVITILLILLTITNAIVCMRNFDKGLKAHLLSPRRVEEKPDAHSISLYDVKPQMPSRMTID